MSVQVAGYCYATSVDAAPAACAAFPPVSQLMPDGSTVQTVGCTGTNPQTGALQITVTTLRANAPQSAVVLEQAPNFPPCVEQDKVDAYMAIFGAALTAIGVCLPLILVYRWLNHNQRSEQT